MREWIVPLVLSGKQVGEFRVIARSPADALLLAHGQLMTVKLATARVAESPPQAAA